MKLFIFLALISASLLMRSPSAEACSCTGVPTLTTFQGELVEVITSGEREGLVDFNYFFRLSNGERREVRIDWVEDERYYYAKRGIERGVSSCGLYGRRLKVGVVYRVTAYVGSSSLGEPKLFVNLCGGGVQAISPELPLLTPVTGDSNEMSERTRSLAITAGALLALVGGASVLVRRATKQR